MKIKAKRKSKFITKQNEAEVKLNPKINHPIMKTCKQNKRHFIRHPDEALRNDWLGNEMQF